MTQLNIRVRETASPSEGLASSGGMCVCEREREHALVKACDGEPGFSDVGAWRVLS